jgi:hypothetical protein
MLEIDKVRVFIGVQIRKEDESLSLGDFADHHSTGLGNSLDRVQNHRSQLISD